MEAMLELSAIGQLDDEKQGDCWLEIKEAKSPLPCDGCERVIPIGERHVANIGKDGCRHSLCFNCMFWIAVKTILCDDCVFGMDTHHSRPLLSKG